MSSTVHAGAALRSAMNAEVVQVPDEEATEEEVVAILKQYPREVAELTVQSLRDGNGPQTVEVKEIAGHFLIQNVAAKGAANGGKDSMAPFGKVATPKQERHQPYTQLGSP